MLKGYLAQGNQDWDSDGVVSPGGLHDTKDSFFEVKIMFSLIY
jgi:hypothetical protein